MKYKKYKIQKYKQIIPLVKCQELCYFLNIFWNKYLKWLWNTKRYKPSLHLVPPTIDLSSSTIQLAGSISQLSSEPTSVSQKASEHMFTTRGVHLHTACKFIRSRQLYTNIVCDAIHTYISCHFTVFTSMLLLFLVFSSILLLESKK